MAVYSDRRPSEVTGESDARVRRQWRAALAVIASLSPRTVIAGHKPPGADDNPRHIELTRRYLSPGDAARLAKTRGFRPLTTRRYCPGQTTHRAGGRKGQTVTFPSRQRVDRHDLSLPKYVSLTEINAQ